MTKAQANGTKASIVEYALKLEESLEEARNAKSNISEEEMRGILTDEIDEAVEDAIETYRIELALTIERGILFEDLKELITGRIEL